MKKTIILLLITMLLPMSVAAQELYAVLSSDQKTLTFYYDTNRSSRSGMVYEYKFIDVGDGWYAPTWNTSRETVTKVVFDQSMTSARPNSCEAWFYLFKKLEQIENLTYLNTQDVTDMSGMFDNCWSLTSLDVSHFDTSHCIDMRGMFHGCSNLTSLDLSHFDTSQCKYMWGMFSYCISLTSLDVSHFNTSQCEDMSYMFSNCRSLTSLDVSHFNTSQCENMSYMFEKCGVTSLNVSHFDTSKCKKMVNMFWDCLGLTSLNVSHFDTSKCEDMAYMFQNCRNLTSLDLTSFRFENVKDISGMFSGCSKLRTIYCNYDLSKLSYHNIGYTFTDCDALTGLLGTSFNGNGNALTYARPDVPGHPGYFTPKECIFVNGETVTGSVPTNYVSRIEDGSAYVIYSAEDQKLTMSNASLTTSGEGIFIPDYTIIELIGKNKITANGNALTFHTESTIRGSGSLDLYSFNGYGLSFSEGLEAVGTGMLDIYGKLGALDGGKWTSSNGNVHYGNLTPSQVITLRSDGEHPVVHEVGMIDREDCVYSYDTYSFTTVTRTVIDTYSKKPVTKSFTLVPKDKITYHPVTIGGQRLNNYNASNFNPMSLASGSVRYGTRVGDQFKVLTLDNAKFVDYAADWDVGLEVNLQKFELRLKGDNSIIGNEKDSFYGITFGETGVDSSVERDWRITGMTGDDGKPASLKCSGSIYFESTDHEADVTFTNVNLTDEDWAYMWSQDYVNVTFDNCSVDLWDKRENPGYTGSIMEALGVVTLNGCHFENGCYWDAENGEVRNSSGKAEQRHVCIRREGEMSYMKGDVNLDGDIDVRDMSATLEAILKGTTASLPSTADVTDDGQVDVRDMSAILNIILGK